MYCNWCGSSSLRTSRFHLLDLPRLILFHYPVRCRDCEERLFTHVFNAVRLRSEAKARRMARHKQKLATMAVMKFTRVNSNLHTSLLHH